MLNLNKKFVPPNFKAPFLLPPPSDFWFFAGDKFTKSFGPSQGTKDHVISTFADFGQAGTFISFSNTTNTVTIKELATTNNDVG